MGMCDIAALMATLTVMLLQPGASQNTLVSCPGCRYLGGAGDSWYYTTKAFYPDDSAATTDDSVLAAANNVTLDANMNGCNITIPCYSQLASCAAATDCPAADTLPACSIQAMYRVASSCSILPVSSPASPSPAMAPSPVPIGMLPVNSPALPSPALAPSPVAHGFLPVNSPASPPPALAPSPVPTPTPAGSAPAPTPAAASAQSAAGVTASPPASHHGIGAGAIAGIVVGSSIVGFLAVFSLGVASLTTWRWFGRREYVRPPSPRPDQPPIPSPPEVVVDQDPAADTGTDHEYDVFLSHVGDETGGFVSRIRYLLRDAGLTVFWDKRELDGCPDTFRAMDAAACKAPVGVIILSKSSFEKRWPLREMRIICRSGHALVPVLFNVALDGVRAQFAVPPDPDSGSLTAESALDDWVVVGERISSHNMEFTEAGATEEAKTHFEHTVAYKVILQCCMLNVDPESVFLKDTGSCAKDFLARTLFAVTKVRRRQLLDTLTGWRINRLNEFVGDLTKAAQRKGVTPVRRSDGRIVSAS